MSWLLPSARQVLPLLKRMAGICTDRHRVGYWREYHAKNFEKRRSYLTAKAREYRGRA